MNRWKCEDCVTFQSLPRQSAAIIYENFTGFPLFYRTGWSYPCEDTANDLVEYYPFQRMTLVPTTCDIEWWFDGTSDTDYRGVYCDNFDGDGNETFQFWPWGVNRLNFSSIYYNTPWVDLTEGGAASFWVAWMPFCIDWYSYPIGPGWTDGIIFPGYGGQPDLVKVEPLELRAEQGKLARERYASRRNRLREKAAGLR